MSEKLNKKLISMLEQAGIDVENKDISILNKKSYKLLISTKSNLAKSGIIIKDFKELNTIWKLNILLSRFVFKYSNFAENYLLALIENYVVLDKESFLKIIQDIINRLKAEALTTDSDKAKNRRRNRVKTLEKYIKSISNFKELKFVEKCTVYNYLHQAKKHSILEVDPTVFSKIRTIRNKAVHSDYIIDYFQDGTPFDNLKSLYNLVDPKYQKNFRCELNKIFKRYKLSFKFKQISLK